MADLEEYQTIEIAIELDKGRSLQEVAETFGISRGTVRKIAVAAGLLAPPTKKPSLKNKVQAEEVQQIVERIEEGQLVEEIALDFAVSAPAIRRLCQKNGVRIPRALHDLKRSELTEIRALLSTGEPMEEVARAYDVAHATLETLREEYKQLDFLTLASLYETLMENPQATPKTIKGLAKKRGIELHEHLIDSYQARLKKLDQLPS